MNPEGAKSVASPISPRLNLGVVFLAFLERRNIIERGDMRAGYISRTLAFKGG